MLKEVESVCFKGELPDRLFNAKELVLNMYTYELY